MSPPKSSVWKNFTKIDSTTAACKKCFKHLKSSGNTSNLAKHLKQHLDSARAASTSSVITNSIGEENKNSEESEHDVASTSSSSSQTQLTPSTPTE